MGCNGTVVRTPLLFEFTDFYSTELDDGTLSEGLRQELALKGVVLSATATVAREGAGKWRIFDHPNGITYRVVLDGGVLKVYQP